MRKVVVIVCVAAAFGLAFHTGRRLLLRKAEKAMFRTARQGPRTPASAGLAFEEPRIQSGGRSLRSFYVPAEQKTAPALLIFHGNGESIGSWVPALSLLHQEGIAAMVFDYSGFGESDGIPTVDNLREDGLAAWSVFRAALPPGSKACAYGFSLGSGILLAGVADLSPAPDCLVVSGVFTSALEIWMRDGRVPRWAWWLFPDPLDNETNARAVRSPFLVVQGELDALFPPAMAARVAKARPGTRLVIVPGMHHADPVVRATSREWDAVASFVKTDKGAKAERR
jgi:uncharacterized protein